MSNVQATIPYVAITRYRGPSGGFASTATTRYRAELIGFHGVVVPLGGNVGGYGFSKRAHAESAVAGIVKALNIQKVYFNEFEKIHKERVQIKPKSASSRNYWVGTTLQIQGDKEIFVFGSNPEGRHGAGAALAAVNHFGAIYGQGRGLQGRSYALPTKNLTAGYYEEASGITYAKEGLQSIHPDQISHNIRELYEHALDNPQLTYYITYQRGGTGLNGYTGDEMRNMFMVHEAPMNVVFHESFE